jgi:hypothetical protein
MLKLTKVMWFVMWASNYGLAAVDTTYKSKFLSYLYYLRQKFIILDPAYLDTCFFIIDWRFMLMDW